ncbi:lipopolysaccharide export system permease protein [Marinospirillum celere]|uniref:Lipopolysaccharide export system permease protein n=1 Tax=Marinospirillum celere TaxID=1122252 RepID=A0A1I1HAG4_9GAMM|nr:LPS export ABC transporter permease LptG [Marinospirillum celere]SFC18483.1 lipopolysaccharide export system permease protein [Marinospirillum celere]
MRLLGRYLSRSVLTATLGVLLVIVGLDYIFTLLEELKRLTDTYTLINASVYLLIRLPERIYLFLPVAILVGVLIGLGSLASTSELTVMRAAGVSIPRLILHASRPVVVLLILAMLVSEFFLLHWAQTADTYRWENRTGRQAATVSTARDLWLKEDNAFYRINVARDDGRLLGITLYELSDDWQLQKRVTAPEAEFIDGDWQLQEAREVIFNEDQLQEVTHANLVLPLPIQPEFVALQAYSTGDLPPSKLWTYGRYLESRGQPSGFYWLAFWQKILLPVTVFAVVILGASFTFGPLRSVPAGTRVFHGIIIGLSVKFAQDLLGPSALLWGFTPALAVLIPAAVCAVWGIWLIRKAG